MEVTLTIHSVEKSREVPLQGTRLTLGRTDAADLVINDSSLSRVHASINRDGERVWIIDEDSTNGSCVNGEPVPPAGTPLTDGDEIYLGNTTIVVNFSHSNISAPVLAEDGTLAPPIGSRLPMAVIAAAAGVLIIGFAVIVIGLSYRRNTESERITMKKYSTSNDNLDSTSTAGSSSKAERRLQHAARFNDTTESWAHICSSRGQGVQRKRIIAPGGHLLGNDRSRILSVLVQRHRAERLFPVCLFNRKEIWSPGRVVAEGYQS